MLRMPKRPKIGCVIFGDRLAGYEWSARSLESDDSIEFNLTKKERVGPILAFFSKREVEPRFDSITEDWLRQIDLERLKIALRLVASFGEVGRVFADLSCSLTRSWVNL